MPIWHTIQVMDLVAACRVFVHVSERSSFTLGAAAARVPQSVASRRIAALEEHFGERLFDRSARRAVLTAFGQDMLPSAKRLLQLAETMEYDAEQARLRPLTIAVPATCSVRELATLDTAIRAKGTVLDVHAADPDERGELLRSGRVQAALIAVPPDAADWTVPLGVASVSGGTQPLRLGLLRPARGQGSLRRIVIQPEDDVPYIRDPLQRLGHRAALLSSQIMIAGSLVGAVSEAMHTGDFLLCPASQADDLGLTWRRLAGAPVARGYSISAMTNADAERIRTVLGPHVARMLGVPVSEARGAAEPGRRSEATKEGAATKRPARERTRKTASEARGAAEPGRRSEATKEGAASKRPARERTRRT